MDTDEQTERGVAPRLPLPEEKRRCSGQTTTLGLWERKAGFKSAFRRESVFIRDGGIWVP